MGDDHRPRRLPDSSSGGDEGLGVHAVRLPSRLPARRCRGPGEVGTAILDALPALETPQRIIIIDAMQAQGAARRVYRICLANCIGSALIACMHGFIIFPGAGLQVFRGV